MINQKRCKICNRFLKQDTVFRVYCSACRRLLDRGAVICYNKHCRNILLVHSPYKHNNHEFCSLKCMMVHYGMYMKYCKKCGLPLINHDKTWKEYVNKTEHKDCEMTRLYFESFENNPNKMIQYNKEGIRTHA